MHELVLLNQLITSNIVFVYVIFVWFTYYYYYYYLHKPFILDVIHLIVIIFS